ncbi:XkdX family protein [Clostridium baratii]|uniref:XkdX family protein n=1 Tax=Clostridium baratii TaxID=1561 RepID=UPI0030D43163
MNNDNFEFWKMAFDMKAIDITLLRQAVITEKNPYGDLTKEQFKEISQEDFENVLGNN